MCNLYRGGQALSGAVGYVPMRSQRTAACFQAAASWYEPPSRGQSSAAYGIRFEQVGDIADGNLTVRRFRNLPRPVGGESPLRGSSYLFSLE